MERLRELICNLLADITIKTDTTPRLIKSYTDQILQLFKDEVMLSAEELLKIIEDLEDSKCKTCKADKDEVLCATWMAKEKCPNINTTDYEKAQAIHSKILKKLGE